MVRVVIVLSLFFASVALVISCGEEKKPVTDTEVVADLDDAEDDDGASDTETGLPEKDTLPPKDDGPMPDEDTPDGDSDATDVDQLWAEGDDDGDGIKNGVECPEQPCRDTDGDETPDYLDDDSDGDGLPDNTEAPGGVAVDTDKDGTPDYCEDDSDDDGILDGVEGTGDADGDGTKNYRDTDSDGDGIPDETECSTQSCVDSDSDDTADYLDTDSDGDGVLDIYETADDFDGDDIPNYLDDDSDDDGITDGAEKGAGDEPADSDGDQLYDFADGDSDNDGLSDNMEHEIGSDPTKEDTDGDEVDDNTEYVLGYDPLDENSTIPEDFFYLKLPYDDPAKVRELIFSTDIRTADVAIMVDLSNSMSGEHAKLKTFINDIIITQIGAAISDSSFGLVKFGPINMNASTPTDKGANVYIPAQEVTNDAGLVEAAVNEIEVTPGTYEYITEALYQTATGAGTYQRICHPVNGCGTSQGGYEIIIDIPAAECPSGRFGGLCFRPGALPIIIMMTDEAFTTDFGTWYSFDKFGNPIADDEPRTLADVIAAMNAVNAKFIGLDSSSEQVAMPFYQTLAEATGSVDGMTGETFNQAINPDGTGMSNTIVDAVIQLTQHISIDVTTMRKHVDNIYGVADTTQFIESITPDEFTDVEPGEKVTFTVTFRNTIYDNQTTESHLFIAKIEVWGAGTLLDTRDCYIIVPGLDPSNPH